MNIKEVMIGDWVFDSANQEPIQIDEETNADEYVAECNPIPLTDGMLKLNDFEYLDDMWCLEDFELTSGMTQMIGGSRWITYKYVHELQHALRLCGLNQAADNFKIRRDISICDLMVGDWVAFGGTPRRWTVNDYSRDCTVLYGFEYIPITADILSSIDIFHLCDDIYQRNITPSKRITIVYNQTDKCWYAKIELNTKTYCASNIPFSYVHELQHILRTCGYKELSNKIDLTK